MNIGFYRLFTLAASVFFLACGVALSADNSFGENYTIEAKEITGVEGENYHARGNVKITFNGMELYADEAIYHINSNTVEANGHVKLVETETQFLSDTLVFDIDNDTAIMDNVTGLVNKEYYVCATQVRRLGKDYYTMDSVNLTTCSAPLPEWSFSFQKVDVTLDGYLFGDHTTFNIKDMPLIYTPKMMFPIKTTRQTGFMLPNIGYSTDMGAILGNEFFWAIDYDKDITLGANSFSTRGLQGLFEGRYAISDTNKIYMSADFIHDSKAPTTDKPNRWGIIGKTFISSSNGLSVTADVSATSDYMYNRSFAEYSTYYNGQNNYENVYHQYYVLAWTSKFSDISVQYRNIDKFHDYSTDNKLYSKTWLEQTPAVSIYKYNISTKYINADYNLDYSKVHYDNKTYYDNNTFSRDSFSSYDRSHADLTLYSSINLGIARLTPSFSGYYTSWNISDGTYSAKPARNSLVRLDETDSGYELFYGKAVANLDINDIYKNYGSFTHGISNIFRYSYVPKVDTSGLPNELESEEADNQSAEWQFVSYLLGDGWSSRLTLKQRHDFYTDKLLPLDIALDIDIGKFYTRTRLYYDYYADEVSVRGGNKLYYISNGIGYSRDVFSAYMTYTQDNKILTGYNTSLDVGMRVLTARLLARVSALTKS
ncbi:hypothetical protein RsTz2092_12070 [Deferribacterales bacterium RsTz2092]|nr:hypothetical protein AGMMS49941_11080 [Deferribacterales bacterium]